MTDLADQIELPRTSRWPMVGWLLLAAAILVLVVSVLGGFLMASVILDVVSFWPAWVVAVLVALALWPLRRRGIARLGAVLPLLVFTWVGMAVALHLQEWEQLPSSAGDLTGPSAEGIASGSLDLEVDGTIDLRLGESGALYEVRLQRSGGDVDPADALERLAAAAATIDVRERSDGGWFRSGGWRVSVAGSVAWELELASPDLEIDLIGLDVRRLTVIGSGVVSIPTPSVQTDVSVSGDIDITVPEGSRVEVFGRAEVPDGWVEAAEGVSSGGDGPAILITVEDGAAVKIIER